MCINGDLVTLKNGMTFDLNAFAVIPKKYHPKIASLDLNSSTPLTLRKISLNDISSQKIIAYFEQGRLVAISKGKAELKDGDPELAELLDLVVEFLESKEAEKVDEKSEPTAKSLMKAISSIPTSSLKFKFITKVLKALNEIISKHLKTIHESNREEREKSTAADREHGKIIDQILYHIRRDATVKEAIESQTIQSEEIKVHSLQDSKRASLEAALGRLISEYIQ